MNGLIKPLFKYYFLFLLLISLFSCKDKCRYVEPVEVCGKPLKVNIFNKKNNTNIFDNDFSLDSLVILNVNLDTISYQKDTVKNLFYFNYFDCYKEQSLINTDVSKTFFIQLNKSTLDTIKLYFNIISPSGECGGTDFKYFKLKYKSNIYTDFYNCKIYR